MERSTAEAWMKAAAILLLLNGAFLIPYALFYPIAHTLLPSQDPVEVGFALGLIIDTIAAIFYLGIGILAVLLGIGLWNYRPWARTTMIVLGWVSAATVALLMLIGLIGSLLIPIPELGAGIAIVLLLIGLLALAASIFHIWLFQFEPTVASLFVPATTPFTISLDERNAPSVVRAVSIFTWATAAYLALIGIVLLVLSLFLPRILEEVPAVIDTGMFILAVVGIGAFLLVLAALMHFVALGLWNMQKAWRTVNLVLIWISIALVVALLVALPFMQAFTFELADSYAQLLFYVALGLLEIWFFNHVLVKKLFKA